MADKHHTELFSSTCDVQFICFISRPRYPLVDNNDEVKLGTYSALQITKNNGAQRIFDGTIIQFGLKYWFISKANATTVFPTSKSSQAG
jgi:hypothetical protein